MLSGAHGKETRDGCDILVFDGELVILELLTRVLDRAGYRPTAARTWEEALHLVATRTYGLAIADLELRRKDGCRLVTALRRVSPETPIIAMTACPAEEVVGFAQRNVDAFLVKPFGIGELLKAVGSVLDSSVPADTSGISSFARYPESAAVLAASG
jgi:two-component system phosphate regulon response regulator OmpR